MNMEKGLAVIEVSDTETKGFHIDQDSLEFERLNARTDKHRKEAAKAQKKDARNRSKAAQAKAQRKAYTLKTVRDVLIFCAICWAVSWAGTAELAQPIITIPVSLFSLCAACVRFGVWYGKVVKQ